MRVAWGWRYDTLGAKRIPMTAAIASESVQPTTQTATARPGLT
jgi:hypothetical protein